MSIQLVIFDVDGTLYDEKTHQVPSSAIAAIKAMKKKQVRFAIATGRAPYGLGKAIDSLHADYVIADSGGLVVDQTGTILWKQDIPYTDVCSLLTFAQEIEAGLVFKFPRHMYIYQNPEKIEWLLGQMNSDIGREPFIFHPEQDRHFLELPQCASLHGDAKQILAFAKNSPLSFQQFSDTGFDVAPADVDKGKAVTRLLQLLQIEPADCACFGDSYNDRSMMEACGRRIAMGNAAASIKAIADHVTSDVDKDGILNGLRYLQIL